jgi:hypothetical protein
MEYRSRRIKRIVTVYVFTRMITELSCKIEPNATRIFLSGLRCTVSSLKRYNVRILYSTLAP